MSENAESKRGIEYIYGLANLGVVFGIVWVLWLIFMHPNTGMRLYTPMYGFALVVVLLSSIVLMRHVFGYYPFFRESRTEGMRLWGRGLILTGIAFGLMFVINYVVFWSFLGKLGITYFSPQSIVAAGGIGAEPYSARENASTAIVYFCAAFLWWGLAWHYAYRRWPWQTVSRGIRVWSRFFAVLFWTILTYVLLFHPHVCYLFYPAQTMAGVDPWWASFTGTGSAYFGLGLVLCTISWLVISDLLWEGYPWKAIFKGEERTFARGLVTIAGTLGLGVALMLVLYFIMNLFWDIPFEGGQYTDAPYFRYLHCAELAGFFILTAFVLKHYFKNFPAGLGLWLRLIIRTAIVIGGGGLVLHCFYYSRLTTILLGKVQGMAQPDDTPLVWTLLFLSIILIQVYFFEGWPLSKKKVSGE